MKTCPSPELLAALALGKFQGWRRRQLLAHARGCAKCQEELRRQAAVIGDLSSAEMAEKGSVSLKLSVPRPEFGRELRATVLKTFGQTKRREHRFRTLVEKLVNELFPIVPPAAEPSALGFRTKRTDVSAEPASSAELAVQKHLIDQLASLLEKLSDPEIPAAVRTAWLARFNAEVEQTRANAMERPPGKARGQHAQTRSTPKKRAKP